jgi:hexokinase
MISIMGIVRLLARRASLSASLVRSAVLSTEYELSTGYVLSTGYELSTLYVLSTVIASAPNKPLSSHYRKNITLSGQIIFLVEDVSA